MNLCYYLKHRIPIMNRHFLKIVSQSLDFVENLCNDEKNPFHVECCKWYSYKISH